MISPMPSTGSPSAPTTRPKKRSPTGMPARRLVRRTALPSETALSSPKRMQPTLSRFKLSTMPRMPAEKSKISPYSACSSPLTSAMPSPTEITVPISSAIALGVHSSRRVRRRGMMSPLSPIACMRASLSWRNLPLRLQSKTSAPTSRRKPPGYALLSRYSSVNSS